MLDVEDELVMGVHLSAQKNRRPHDCGGYLTVTKQTSFVKKES